MFLRSLFAIFLLPLLVEAKTILEPLDYVSDNLFYETEDGFFAIQAGGSAEITGYYFNEAPIGFIFVQPGNHTQYHPRLTLEADAFVGERLSGSIKFRWDDGIDPGYMDNQVRLDEIFADGVIVPGHLDLRVGRFATIFGNWVPRLDAWDNPFISPPLAYDQATSVSDLAVPANALSFASRRTANDSNFLKTWLPIIWGPVYTQGIAAFASWGGFDLAVSGTNESLATRPSEWDDYDWTTPTFTGRLGYTHSAEWQFGLSGSIGSYFRPAAEPALPLGTDVGDYQQVVVGVDATWSSGPWQVWGEFLFSQFDIPNVSDPAQIFSYYIETKYKVTPQFYTALRFGHQFYNEIDTILGSQNWENDQIRAEVALGYKFDRHSLFKVQYQFQHQFTSFQDGENQIAAQFVIKF
ncbi:MAG: hypothetical protein AAFX93_06385 [Verrucomicrobiota bacterium]